MCDNGIMAIENKPVFFFLFWDVYWNMYRHLGFDLILERKVGIEEEMTMAKWWEPLHLCDIYMEIHCTILFTFM